MKILLITADGKVLKDFTPFLLGEAFKDVDILEERQPYNMDFPNLCDIPAETYKLADEPERPVRQWSIHTKHSAHDWAGRAPISHSRGPPIVKRISLGH